jgi:hypothetical protein
MSDEYDTLMARALRLAVVRNVYLNEHISREEALVLLNDTLSHDPDDPIYDDRDKLDWTLDQFKEWMAEAMTDME